MKKAKKIVAVALAAASMSLAFAGCGGSAESSKADNSGTDGKVYNIGICQLIQHEALDAATKGFKDYLTEKLGADNVKFDEQNAQGDSATCATICNQFVSSNYDLILGNGTAALQAAYTATPNIPILGTSITDYGTALDKSDWNGVSGMNVSGTTDLAPLDQQAAMLKELFPDAKNVGILYCSAEANSKYQCDTITPYFKDAGYTVKSYSFADSNDVAAVAKTACDESDVLYIRQITQRHLTQVSSTMLPQPQKLLLLPAKKVSARAAVLQHFQSAMTNSAEKQAKWLTTFL